MVALPDFNTSVDTAIHYLLEHDGFIFDAIARMIDHTAAAIESALGFLTPWGLLTVCVIISVWRIGKRFALFALLANLFIGYCGFTDQAVVTLALTLSATLFSVCLGVPLGILATRRQVFGTVLRPVLDFMQTMPAFVYLIPATILFGLGRPPGIFATILFAMPPVVRLTYLGIKQVEPALMEAGQVLGGTDWQILWKIELPSAIPSIMVGINQTIMMAMSMVIIAAMVGAGGLGNDILTSIQQLNIGLGLQSGTVVVILAILLDRITASFARRYEALPG